MLLHSPDGTHSSSTRALLCLVGVTLARLQCRCSTRRRLAAGPPCRRWAHFRPFFLTGLGLQAGLLGGSVVTSHAAYSLRDGRAAGSQARMRRAVRGTAAALHGVCTCAASPQPTAHGWQACTNQRPPHVHPPAPLLARVILHCLPVLRRHDAPDFAAVALHPAVGALHLGQGRQAGQVKHAKQSEHTPSTAAESEACCRSCEHRPTRPAAPLHPAAAPPPAAPPP